MKKASIVVTPHYSKNKLFNLNDPLLNRDNCLYSFSALKNRLQTLGYDLSTDDINPPAESEFIIFNEMPKNPLDRNLFSKSFLLLFETDLIRPDNWDKHKHLNYKKIFTWNDSFVDNKKYFKFNFSHLFPKAITRVPFEEKKLCTLIAGNKFVYHPLELYTQRLRAINWFDTHHPDQFDLYGIGWNNYLTPSKILNKILIKTNLISLIPNKPPKTYRGTVENKNQVMSKYKFSICYENACDIPGYITEKIFDSFFAGCVPVYWGANNIDKHIPKNCYIDKRLFNTYEELYKFLTHMPKETYNNYLDAIEDFLKSPRSNSFQSQYFAETICNNVVN